MKKILLILILMLSLSAVAYEEIKAQDKIYYNLNSAEFSQVKDENSIELTRKVSSGTASLSEYYDENNNLYLSPETNCEFIHNNKLYGYSGDEMKFYEITKESSNLLTKDEVQKLFPDYKIITISQFDKNRKYKMKNSLFKSKKILILNNRKRTFHKFFIYPESSRNSLGENDKRGTIKSLITIYGKKNVTLKHAGGDKFEIVVR